ncbi:glutamine-hydrolyzing GMP synthase [Lentisphaera profundi]|uniref:GMP synthase (glutamine-hydrolyzing) n=1 Tax=Lentisphaera profundi TaxID=1658616 RepID=A0ABY7VZR9_9BACT|nr:glutamine-hydrolyzing GMP synthase [Lentisphaera profundi]WDE98695.1 glutamine-hydrolyzing GMP synthase [Lentisphaera profundi]
MDKIGVLDFGGQYAHLIANRVRRMGVYSEIVSPTAELSTLSSYKGLIFSGGPSSVYAAKSPSFNKDILNFNGPILGICYGHQLICHILGGEVKPGTVKEYGIARVAKSFDSPLYKGLSDSEVMWMSHGDSVAQIPDGFEITASTPDCPVASVQNLEKKIFGLQFHPEVTHSKSGLALMKNFLKECGCTFDWDIKAFMQASIDNIRHEFAGKKVFLLVSGGVDSNVAFALLNKALGDENVYGLHVDNGLMRKDESAWVKEELKLAGFENFHVVDAGETFLKNLAGVSEPQAKRIIIGDTFLDVKCEAVEESHLVDDTWLLGQGTIYPDTIESGGTENSHLIKTHHNRVDRIQELINQGKVIEPLAELYKDEVRELGELLGLPHKLVWRHPFPGPGLGVRILCSDTEETDDYSAAEARINTFLEKFNVTGRILPVKSVGVQGDARTYAHPCVITGEADWEVLEEISTSLTNRFPEVNRVIYNVGGDDWSGDILLKKCDTSKDRLDRLREADQVVTDYLFEKGLYESIWQMPVALIPVGRNKGGESLVLRPINSTEAMTASFSRIPQNQLQEMISEIRKKADFDGIFYDVTNKPPGTIEWE